jgi:hypothetical protein
MKSEKKNIVEMEFEKLDLPENVIAEVMSYHGGVYGMVPREVWDEKCMPQSMLEAQERHLAYSLEFGENFSTLGPILYNKWFGQFEKFKDLVRPENWCIGDEDNDSDTENEYYVETFSVYMDIDPNQIPEDLTFTIDKKVSETLWEIVIPYREITRRDERVHEELMEFNGNDSGSDRE